MSGLALPNAFAVQEEPLLKKGRCGKNDIRFGDECGDVLL